MTEDSQDRLVLGPGRLPHTLGRVPARRNPCDSISAKGAEDQGYQQY